MERRRLGSGGPEITVVGFGSWEAGGADWGPNESDDRVIEAIRATIDAGMNWIDTAEVYGDGRSEELVGRAVGGHRDDVRIFTKVAPEPDGSGFRPEQVRAAAEGSLGRLGVESVDLYQLHWPDESGVPVEETWGAMAEVVDRGLARHIGVSNFDPDLILRCEAVRHVDSLQSELSLVRRADAESGLLGWLAERGIGYLAYSPLGAGMLTGAVTADTVFAEHDWRSGKTGEEQPDHFRPENLAAGVERVGHLARIAERLGTSVGALALRWVIEQPGVTAAIAGTRNPRHVHDNASAGDLRLDDDTLREIEALFS
jgi:aryl-alcohol dehydrogenase-like predicted oxidoreductase